MADQNVDIQITGEGGFDPDELSRSIADLIDRSSTTLETSVDQLKDSFDPLVNSLQDIADQFADVTGQPQQAFPVDELSSLDNSIDNLIDALEESARFSPPPTPSSSQKEPDSPFDVFIDKIFRPLNQATFTQTLFRNNLERGVSTLLKGAVDFAQKIAQIEVPQSPRGSGQGGGGNNGPAQNRFNPFQALARVAPRTSFLLARTFGSIAAVGGILVGTFSALVAGAGVFNRALRNSVDNLQGLSPEVSLAQALNDIDRTLQGLDLASEFGDRLAAGLRSGNELSLELQRTRTELIALISPAFNVLNSALVDILKFLNEHLDMAFGEELATNTGDIAASINGHLRLLRKMQVENGNDLFTNDALIPLGRDREPLEALPEDDEP